MPNGTWIFDGSDNWSNAARWSSATIADGAGSTANFTNNITLARTVTLDSGRTIGALVFSDNAAAGSAWTLAGANTLTLDNSGNTPTITTTTDARVVPVLAGTDGLSFSAARKCNTSTAHTLTGTITATGGTRETGGIIVAGSIAGAAISNINVFPGTGGTVPPIVCSGEGSGITYHFNGSNTLANDFSGTGFVTFRLYNTTARTLDLTGDLTGLNGTSTTVVGNGEASSGLNFQVNSTGGIDARSLTTTLSSLPSQIMLGGTATGGNITNVVQYTGTGSPTLRRILLFQQGGTSWANSNVKFAASGTSPVNLDLGILRKNLNESWLVLFRLGGTNTGDNQVSGNISSESTGVIALRKEDAGKWVLSGANVYTGVTTINAGTLAAASTTALGTTGAITVEGTGQLMLQGGVTVNKASAAFTIHANNPIVSIGDNTIQTAGILLGGTTTFEVTTGNKLTIANTQAIDDAGSTFGITKTGAGELALAGFANTYDGNVSVQAGTLTVTTLNNSGVAGVLGRSTSPLELLATLRFAGSSTASSNRAMLLQGATPTLEATGTAAVTYSGTVTQTSEARQLVLTGTSTAANALASALANNSFATGIQKTGTGTWRMTGAMSYTGATDVDQGTLRVERPDGNTMASTVTVDAGAFLELATDTMASSGATAGRVLGTGNVVVNGTVKTRGGTTQKGQVRYGGNLTFGSGSSLHIGAAA